MAHHNPHEQPGLEVHEQAGLEVVPEPEAPQVLNGPTVNGKPFDQADYAHPGGLPYEQHDTPVNGGYGQYPTESPYTASTVHPPQSQWAPSHIGTLGPSASEKGPSEPTILGIRRRKFWLIFGPLLAVLVIGLAVGLGVGLGTGHSHSSSTSSSATSTSTTSSASATATVSAITCPSSNGSFYEADSTRFLVLCNLDYNSGGGSEDIGNVITSTVEDCASSCAGNGSCAGAGWGDYYGSTYCWMKSSLGTSQSASNWYFLVKE
ncbi:hypothetical protein SCAR479_08441 [Seiridium cardinale]|uniref:Apple domain-containing protein n=1 Tax=Seiridium cardinale TaxID=138064 RepID=A0ABR2XM51_9PEZI